MSLRHNYKYVLKSLCKTSLSSNKTEERAKATGLIKSNQTFEVAMLVAMQDKILSSVNLLSQFLQRQDMNLFDATSLLNAALVSVKNAREEFDATKTAVTYTTLMGIRT